MTSYLFEHIDKLTGKLTHRIALLNKMSNYLPLRERIAYYNATVKSIMMYGSNIWSNTSKENLERIAKLQKRAARPGHIRSVNKNKKCPPI